MFKNKKRFNKIKKYEKLMNDLNLKVKKYISFLELVKENYINKIKSLVDYSELENNLIRAYTYDYDEKNEEGKKSLKYIKEWLLDFDCSVKLDSIMSDLNNDKYFILFKYKNEKYIIDVPILKKLTLKNRDYMCDGKLRLCKDIGGDFNSLCLSYDKEDLIKSFKVFI